MFVWIDFNDCVKAQINSCHLQLALIEEMYQLVLKCDPFNVTRWADLLAQERQILDDITRLIGLMVKYQTLGTGQLLSAGVEMGYQLN